MHVPVLAGAVIQWLRVREGGTYIDCTAGGGGHAELIAQRIGQRGRLLALDRDAIAVEQAAQRLSGYPGVEVVRANYATLVEVVEARGVRAVDGILIDAGLSSMQLDDPARGFSFQEEGPLDMRMDTDAPTTAQAYLASVAEDELKRVLREYGDLKKARALARAIVQWRDQGRMNTTSDLVAAVSEVFDFVSGVPEETRTVFQAIRIAVNEELDSLQDGLNQAIDLLAPEGRIVAISFHSGEDRIVKNTLRAASRKHTELHPDGRVKETYPPTLKLLTPKPALPSAEETAENPRAHSAKLRAAERILPEEKA